MENIFVIGHKIPDTDSVVSAILYSQYLNGNGQNSKAVLLGKINNETRFLLQYAGYQIPDIVETLPQNSKVFLVDHNEKAQTIKNIDDLNLIGIIDHHKFGNLSTNEPIFVRTQPLCSTASIIYKLYKESNLFISQETAVLFIGAIISDSLFFRSPTTTNEDKIILQELNQIAGISNLEDFSLQLFDAKSDLGDISALDLIKIDYKEFDFNGKLAGIGVVETTNPNYSLNRKDELLQAMKELKSNSNLDFILFSVVDILSENNVTIVLGTTEEEIINKVFNVEVKNSIANLGNILSRKKQIVPKLESYFKN